MKATTTTTAAAPAPLTCDVVSSDSVHVQAGWLHGFMVPEIPHGALAGAQSMPLPTNLERNTVGLPTSSARHLVICAINETGTHGYAMPGCQVSGLKNTSQFVLCLFVSLSLSLSLPVSLRI